MDHITIYKLRKLKSSGFSYPEYEHFLNVGMLYFYNDDEYLIGGFCKEDFSEKDRAVALHGEWLPEASQLPEWLQKQIFKLPLL